MLIGDFHTLTNRYRVRKSSVVISTLHIVTPMLVAASLRKLIYQLVFNTEI